MNTGFALLVAFAAGAFCQFAGTMLFGWAARVRAARALHREITRELEGWEKQR